MSDECIAPANLDKTKQVVDTIRLALAFNAFEEFRERTEKEFNQLVQEYGCPTTQIVAPAFNKEKEKILIGFSFSMKDFYQKS